jgi:hypothetical protein
VDNNGDIIRYLIETVPIDANLQVRIFRYLIATVSIDVKTMPIPIETDQSPSKESRCRSRFPLSCGSPAENVEKKDKKEPNKKVRWEDRGRERKDGRTIPDI